MFLAYKPYGEKEEAVVSQILLHFGIHTSKHTLLVSIQITLFPSLFHPWLAFLQISLLPLTCSFTDINYLSQASTTFAFSGCLHFTPTLTCVISSCQLLAALLLGFFRLPSHFLLGIHLSGSLTREWWTTPEPWLCFPQQEQDLYGWVASCQETFLEIMSFRSHLPCLVETG